MPDDIEDFRRWMALPETNCAAFDSLVADAMADIEFSAAMRVVNVVMADKES